MSKLRSLEGITVEQYKQALARVLVEGISRQQLRILRAHLMASGQRMTATELAHEVGYKTYRPVNSQYGTLAKRVAQTLGRSRPPDGDWLFTFIRDPEARRLEDDFPLVLRPGVVAAARWLGLDTAWAAKVLDRRPSRKR